MAGLPSALLIVGEADVLLDEGGACAASFWAPRVLVTSVRYLGIIDDFVMLNALRGTEGAGAATAQGGESVPTPLWESPIGGQCR
jgi:acetyl esterase